MRTHRCRTRGCTVAPLLGSVDVQDRQPPAKPAQQRTPRRARRDAGGDRPVRRPWDRRSLLTRFLYVNLRGHRALVVVAVSLTIGLVLCDLGLAFPLKFILDKYVNHQDPSFPLSGSVLPWFNHFGSTHGLVAGEHYTTVGVIVYSTALLLALGLIEAALSYAQLFIAAFIGQSLAAHLRTRLFDHLQRLSLEWHSRQHTGDLVQRLTGNIADIEKLVTDGLVDLLAGILTLVGMLTVMLLLNWQFTIVTMLVVPAMFACVFGYTRSIKTATKRAAKDTADVADIATDDIGAITEIKAFTLEDRESRHFRRFSRHLYQSKFAAGTLQAEFTPLVMVLMAASNAAILGIGAYVMVGNTFSLGFLTIPGGSVSTGTLTLFITYLKQLYQPMRDLSKLTNIASSAGSAAERIQAALDQEPEIDDHPAADRPKRAHGGIVYRGVYFGYSDGDPVLRRVDLDIASGKRVALVGLSGSGKTTMVKLIPRFYDVWDGSVELDGEAEAEVMRAIDTLIEGRTVVMISHRLSTLGHADEIIVLADGEIAEQGSFSELERSQGIFARMLAEQYQYSPLRVGGGETDAAADIQDAESGLAAARSISTGSRMPTRAR